MAFCRLYGTDEDQLLVVKATDSDGLPIINISCEAITYVGSTTRGLITFQLRYGSESSRDTAFDAMTEDEAQRYAAVTKDKLAEQLAIERKQLASRLDLS